MANSVVAYPGICVHVSPENGIETETENGVGRTRAEEKAREAPGTSESPFPRRINFWPVSRERVSLKRSPKDQTGHAIHEKPGDNGGEKLEAGPQKVAGSLHYAARDPRKTWPASVRFMRRDHRGH